MRVFFLALALAAVAVASATDEAAIRQADKAWADAVAAKSLEQTAAFYDAEIATAGSAMQPVRGLAEIRAMWTKYFALPGFALTWDADKVFVTASGTIGYSTGTWRWGKQTGPYIAVWRKQRDGRWKVLIDSAWISPVRE